MDMDDTKLKSREFMLVMRIMIHNIYKGLYIMDHNPHYMHDIPLISISYRPYQFEGTDVQFEQI